MTLATSTGTAALGFGAPAGEQPAARSASAKPAGTRQFFFMLFSFQHALHPASRGTKRRRKLFQKTGVFTLELRIAGRLAGDQPRGMGKRHRKHRQRQFRQHQMPPVKFRIQPALDLPAPHPRQCARRAFPAELLLHHPVAGVLQRLPAQQPAPSPGPGTSSQTGTEDFPSDRPAPPQTAPAARRSSSAGPRGTSPSLSPK